MKIQEIQKMASGYGIKSRGKSKALLIKEIQKAEGNFDCFGSASDYCDQRDCYFRSDCLAQHNERRERQTGVQNQG